MTPEEFVQAIGTDTVVHNSGERSCPVVLLSKLTLYIPTSLSGVRLLVKVHSIREV